MTEPESSTHDPGIGIIGVGEFVPSTVITAADLSEETGIPEPILHEKFGIDQVHRAGEDCHVSDMASAAGSGALEDAGLSPSEVDLVVYCGSEYKDHIVWSAATHIAGLLGCSRAEAYEVYALCAGAPIALRLVKDMMLSEPDIRTALVVAASKESALVNRANDRTRFMANFGDGAGAVVVSRDAERNLLLGSASLVDSALSMSTIMPAGGSRRPIGTSDEADVYLDVPDLDAMRDRLDEVSGANFSRVASEAMRRSNVDKIDVLVPVHVKYSTHAALQAQLKADRAVYLREYGHMQAADQLVGLLKARRHSLLREGDIVLLLAAGVGYTWSAAVLQWGEA